MGLFRKLTNKAQPQQQQQRQQQQYAPPPGPPPQQYQGGYQSSAAQPQYNQQPYQQQQQQYAPPPGPPPAHLQQQNQAPAQARQNGREDPLSALARYDTFFLVDDSESMEMFWDEVAKALATTVDIAATYDSDGVELAFFNSQIRTTSRNSQELLQLFRRVDPRRSTPSASALKRVLEPYMDNLENWQIEGEPIGYPRPKPLNLIVLTDGAPDRGENPEPVLVDIARRLDKINAPSFQIGIQFVQIGTDDEAAEHLRQLDDDLRSKHNVRDFVDTTLFDAGRLDEGYMLKALLGGVNRGLDGQSSGAEGLVNNNVPAYSL